MQSRFISAKRAFEMNFFWILQVELTANHSEIAKNGLRRLWGVPDTSAYVGHLFRMEIPKEAFSGEVLAYKVHSTYIWFVSQIEFWFNLTEL